MSYDNFVSENKMNITLPVPYGSAVYKSVTCCGRFCIVDSKRFNSLFPEKDHRKRCYEMGNCCRTISLRPDEDTLDINSIREIFKRWDVDYFATFEEAKNKSETLANENRKRMRELGFKMDQNGNAIIEKGE